MRLVDADEIIKKQRDLARRTCDEVYANDWHNPVILGMASMYGIVADAPTIDPVKHEHWIINKAERYLPTTDENGNVDIEVGLVDQYECSVCHKEYGLLAREWSYCPNCGAKMDGDNNG